MATYKTPDVYVEEISIFPPSVAEVETAIPAFIGYTEMATKTTDGDLHLVPTKIHSILEFKKYFGAGSTPRISKVYLDEVNNFRKADISMDFYLYESVRLFYDNGGGDCYIISVGCYDADIEKDDFTDGLTALEKYDEPTLIVFPDAVKLTAGSLGDVQKAALAQCNSLKDRFGVFDLLENDANGDDFRDDIGVNYLKYGAAYTPWLKVVFPKRIFYRHVKDKAFKTGSVDLASLTTDANIIDQINDVETIIDDVNAITAAVDAITDPCQSFRNAFTDLVADYEAHPSDHDKYAAIYAFLYSIAEQLDPLIGTGGSKFGDTTLLAFARDKAASGGTLNTAFATLVKYENEIKADLAALTTPVTYTTAASAVTASASQWGTIFTSMTATDLFSGDDEAEILGDSIDELKIRFEELYAGWLSIVDKANDIESKNDELLYEAFPVYKGIVKGLNDVSVTMPPSGAVVGIYAATDRDRGVWKAPANVSLTSTIGPTSTFTASELDALNIDVNAGKSINAIRAFTGRGTLIWGARTLAGNDNEWRYIPVRRFYNMVEESIKKSTYWAVFEPNTASTWVKVKGMIENYLTNKWKDGALAGAKPDEAYFVKIGLGSTMTAQDILEGRMNVEIGMAVVRPAEFIILKFSHKLQQS